MAEDRRPILAVDVDGVLNALSGGTRPPPGWEDHQVMGLRLRLNPSHGALLAAVAAERGAELVWCTTWEEMAPEHVAPLVGLPDMPWVPMSPGRRGLKLSQARNQSIGSEKARAIAAYAGDRPFCWLDDEHDAEQELRSHPVPHRVIRVSGRAGLQDHHLRRASEWFAELAKLRASQPPYPTHPFAGTSSERQSVGLPGHCERCAEVGHVLAHPSKGCGDVGCSKAHGPDEPADSASGGKR